MKVNPIVVLSCTLMVALLVDSCHAQKLNIHWGPQSMMYLKGKHGRRLVSEEHSGLLREALQHWYAMLTGLEKPESLQEKRAAVVGSGEVFINYIRKR